MRAQTATEYCGGVVGGDGSLIRFDGVTTFEVYDTDNVTGCWGDSGSATAGINSTNCTAAP